ncbi:NUDIX domain-containing protein [Proteiniclasticum sp. C24MP]
MKGENPHAAAIRELKEQTGIEAQELVEIYRKKVRDTL